MGFGSGKMSNDVFDLKILAEKLSKLNNSQQSIESLSRWCISHRKKARHIVETWEKMFNSSQKDRCISFLYLANDILQNSRRKGGEFVNEFWKVLPGALRQVYDNGDESGKKAATRLVDIWEERKVFGSRVQSLKDEIMAIQGKDPVCQVASNGKSANPIKIAKKDAHSLRVKLPIGEFPEKIVSAFHCLHDECGNEGSALTRCDAAVLSVEKIVKKVESAIAQGMQLGSGIADEMQKQENVLEQCVKQLGGAEATRANLAGLLKEALQEQEAKLENIRHQLLIARSRIDELERLKPKLTSHIHGVSAAEPQNFGELSFGELAKPAPHATATSLQIAATPSQPIGTPQISPVHQITQIPPSQQPATAFASLTASDEDSKKAAAAAVAAKLAASTSSAQMLTSVLSSLVAEEAASMNDNLKKVGFPATLPMFSPDKRQKLEHPSSGAHVSGIPISQASQSQASIAPLAPPLPPPPLMPSNPSSNPFAQSAGMMMNMSLYGIHNNGLPPPPPLPSHLPMALAGLPIPQSSQPLQPPQQPAQQHNASGGYCRPPGIGPYATSSQPSTPPVHRQ